MSLKNDISLRKLEQASKGDYKDAIAEILRLRGKLQYMQTYIISMYMQNENQPGGLSVIQELCDDALGYKYKDLIL